VNSVHAVNLVVVGLYFVNGPSLEIIKMSSPSQNITPYPSNFQGTPAMPMGYEQFQPPSKNLNAKKIKKENDKLLSRTCRHRFFMGRVLLSLCHGTL
jgi:hypothetical protein